LEAFGLHSIGYGHRKVKGFCEARFQHFIKMKFIPNR